MLECAERERERERSDTVRILMQYRKMDMGHLCHLGQAAFSHAYAALKACASMELECRVQSYVIRMREKSETNDFLFPSLCLNDSLRSHSQHN